MKVKMFVTGSGALLAAWLGATFFTTVPVKSYPLLGPGSVPISAESVTPAAPVADAGTPKATGLLAKTGAPLLEETAAAAGR